MFFFYFFYGRLILRPWWTEVRESFTGGGPWVSLKNLLLGFFLVILKLQGGPKSDEISHIFRPRPQTFCSHARTRQNIVILKKKLVKHRWFLYNVCHVWWTLAYKPLRSTRTKILKKMTRMNSLRHVLFPFARCQHVHARTPYDTVIVCPMLCPNPLTPWPINLDPLTPTSEPLNPIP